MIFLFPKLFCPTVRKNGFSDRKILFKFKAENWEFAKLLRSLGRFIQTVIQFLKQNAFLTYSWRFLRSIRTIIIQIGKKLLGLRNLQEKLENTNSSLWHLLNSRCFLVRSLLRISRGFQVVCSKISLPQNCVKSMLLQINPSFLQLQVWKSWTLWKYFSQYTFTKETSKYFLKPILTTLLSCQLLTSNLSTYFPISLSTLSGKLFMR